MVSHLGGIGVREKPGSDEAIFGMRAYGAVSTV